MIKELTLEELDALLAERLKIVLKELGLTEVDKRYMVYPGIQGADKPGDDEWRDRANKFFRAVIFGQGLEDESVKKALAEGVDASGGYLVPTELRREIVMRLPDLSELYPFCRKIPVTTKTEKVPTLATDVTMSWGSENTKFTESTPQFGQKPFDMNRVDALAKTSRELLADAIVDLTSFLTDLFADAAAAERDKMIAIGSGSGRPEGVYYAAGISAVAVGGAISYDKLIDIYSALAKKYRRSARWIMNNTQVQRISKLKDDDGRPLWRPGLAEDRPDLLLGRPISEQVDLPNSFIGFGNLNYYWLLEREDMSFESTTVAGEAFEKHQLWLKAWERYDGKVVLPAGFSKGTGITS